MLRFILYVLIHGRLFGRPVDFSEIEEEHLKNLPTEKSDLTSYQKIRKILAHNKITGSLVSNIAYFNNLPLQNKNFFFVDSLQLGYIRILKSASTSTLRSLLPLIDNNLNDQTLTDKQIDLLATRYSSTQITPKQEQYSLFTIVRNPFQRLVSVYLDLFNPENPHFGYRTYLFGIFKRKMTFQQFVHVVSIIPDKLKSGHLAPQLNIIDECGGLKKIKCYRLDKDRELLETSLKSKGLKVNHSNRYKMYYDYKSYYDKDTAEKVYKIYRKDITVFDYQQEFESLLSQVKG